MKNETPDVVVNVVDASNLERNLYLTLVLKEQNRPLVVVLNMIDVARRHGIDVDAAALSKELGVPVLQTVGNRGVGVQEILAEVVRVAESPNAPVETSVAPACPSDAAKSCEHCGGECELAQTAADVLHTTPYRSYPTGVTATASKRYEYLHWAKQKPRYIIEDDYESEFSVSNKPTETLFSLCDGDQVIYLNTFSKTLSPAFRIGYMVLPRHLVAVFEEKLGFYSCTVPTFMQYVLAELMDNGDFERHINRVRRKKRKELEK